MCGRTMLLARWRSRPRTLRGARAELAACLSMAHGWRAQDNFLGVSLDVGELREAQQMVAARRARLDALERELGSETDSGSGSESGSEEDEATELGDDRA